MTNYIDQCPEVTTQALTAPTTVHVLSVLPSIIVESLQISAQRVNNLERTFVLMLDGASGVLSRSQGHPKLVEDFRRGSVFSTATPIALYGSRTKARARVIFRDNISHGISPQLNY